MSSTVADALRELRRIGEIDPSGDIFAPDFDHRGGCTNCPPGECPYDDDYYEDE